MRELNSIKLDTLDFAADKSPKSVKITLCNGFRVVTDTESNDYIGFELTKQPYFDEKLTDSITARLARALNKFLRKHGITKDKSVLVVGVGNENITADALGARTLTALEVTEHFYAAGYLSESRGRLAAIAAGVSGVTGIASYDVITALVGRIKPDIIIAVDTFCTDRLARLARVIEVSDRGMTPGGGVGNAKTELSKESLGVPIIAVGVPLVIYARHIVAAALKDANAALNISAVKEFASLIVTGKDVDLSVECYAKIIGKAVNIAVHG